MERLHKFTIVDPRPIELGKGGLLMRLRIIEVSC